MPTPHDPWQILTETEYRVLAYAADGLNNAEIGERLFMSVDTVKTHMRKILKRLKARNRTHAVVIAIRRGQLRLKPWTDGPD